VSAAVAEVLAVRPEGIPDELKAYRAWVLWKLVGTERGWTKHPYSVHTGRRASSTDSRTWGSFEEVWEAYGAGGYDGIGFVFSSGDPYCGVDLDGAVDPDTGELAGWAAGIVEVLDGYAELSPSGEGVHVVVRGKVPPGGNRRGPVEMYDRERFFTVTGHALGERC
jgi:primase-polymerase (primpol)-like protein